MDPSHPRKPDQESESALYNLLGRPGIIADLDAAFCRTLAGVVGAEGVIIHERRGAGADLEIRSGFPDPNGPESELADGPGAGVSAAAAVTGEIASHHGAKPGGGAVRLRLAVPINQTGRLFVIEVLKNQSQARPTEHDLFLIQTFGAMLAARIAAGAGAGPGGDESPTEPAPTDSAAVGKSSAFTRAQMLAVKAARSDCPVLILGETGTGKELVARQLHDASRRRAKPYVAINCGALSEALLESEFFGHARGAFTGAYRSRKGRLEEADGGTVFLDEIAEMSASCQVKLLRTLDTGEITPIGGNKTTRVNVRFIAATHRNLEEMIQQGRFREDLFYRLQGIRIELPPLRRRRGDAELLANFFFEREAGLQASQARGFSNSAMEVLRAHAWPGNIRELKQVVASAVAICDGEWIEPEDLPPYLASAARPPTPPAGTDPRAEEKARLLHALKTTAYPGTGRWNMRAAARLLGMDHQALSYRVLKVYRLRDE